MSVTHRRRIVCLIIVCYALCMLFICFHQCTGTDCTICALKTVSGVLLAGSILCGFFVAPDCLTSCSRLFPGRIIVLKGGTLVLQKVKLSN